MRRLFYYHLPRLLTTMFSTKISRDCALFTIFHFLSNAGWPPDRWPTPRLAWRTRLAWLNGISFVFCNKHKSSLQDGGFGMAGSRCKRLPVLQASDFCVISGYLLGLKFGCTMVQAFTSLHPGPVRSPWIAGFHRMSSRLSVASEVDAFMAK
jgi:hypothetical protein